MRVSSAEVARHALRIGSCCLDDESWAALDDGQKLPYAQRQCETLALGRWERFYDGAKSSGGHEWVWSNRYATCAARQRQRHTLLV